MEMKSHPVSFVFVHDLKNIFPILVKNIGSVVKSGKSPSSFIETLNTSIKGGNSSPTDVSLVSTSAVQIGKSFPKSHIFT